MYEWSHKLSQYNIEQLIRRQLHIGFHIYFRVLWVIIVLGSISLFMIQVGERMRAYFNYETNVDVELIYPKDIVFPVVTLCNQNKFKLVELMMSMIKSSDIVY